MPNNVRKWRTISVRTVNKLRFNRLKAQFAEVQGREYSDDEFMDRLLSHYTMDQVSSTTLRPNKVLPDLQPVNTSIADTD